MTLKRLKPIKKIKFSDRLSSVRETVGSKVFDIVNIILLVAIALIMLYPMYYVIILSFSSGSEVLKGGIFLFPRGFTLANYEKVFSEKQLIRAFVISIGRTVIGTFVSVLLISMLAYGLSVKSLPGRKFLNKFFFFTTIFSGGAIPTLCLLVELGLLDNFFVYIIPAIYSFFNMLIIRTQFESIPSSLKESAQIDGASNLRIFFTIYMPLSKSALATVALFTAVFHWCDWYAGKYYIQTDMLKPAATVLQEMLDKAMGEMSSQYAGIGQDIETTSSTLQMAFVVVIMLPIMLVYPFLQKHFAKGAMIGSIKE